MTTALERGEHGTTSYRLGCGCPVCRSATRRPAREMWAARNLLAGRDPPTRVHSRRVREHLDRLAALGISAQQVARRAGVAPSTLSRARGARNVSRIVARLVLAVEP